MRMLALLSVSALILSTSAAMRAATITQTDDVGPTVSKSVTVDTTAFDQFNTALGTLTSVTLTIYGPVTFTPPTGPFSGLATYSLIAADESALDTKLLDKSTSSTLDLVDTVTNATLLKEFDGTGTFDGSISLSSLLGSANGSGLTETLTYNYTPAATPEPSSLLLLGTGALGLAAAARRRAFA